MNTEKQATKRRLKARSYGQRYRHWAVQGLLIAFFSGTLCFYGYQGGFSAWMMDVPFFKILGLFVFGSYVVTRYLFWINAVLDREVRWDKMMGVRIVYQAVMCWVLPCFFFTMVYALLSYFSPLQMRESKFIQTNLFVVALVLLVTNLCGMLYNAYNLLERQARYSTVIKKRKRKLDEKYGILERTYASLVEQSESSRALIVRVEEQLAKLTTSDSDQIDTQDNKDRKREKFNAGPFMQDKYEFNGTKAIESMEIKNFGIFFFKDKQVWCNMKDDPTLIITKEESLKMAERNLRGHYRIVDRKHCIGGHLISRCRQVKGGILIISVEKPIPQDFILSRERSKSIKPWILNYVKIEIDKGDKR
ncbi:hypothetical protein [Sphingobacterium sp. LRF_L2]|uniref:hypothetical protein n=1 Tax=Sphingobacterium sp. LRF_L2 TaxID=3369421 RepID=UPI003F5EA685